MLNVKQVEIFYYVAKARGIARAVKTVPWGIQQPAISGAMKDLETASGRGALFVRGPEFRLTDAGQELFDIARPFFEALDRFGGAVMVAGIARLRLACSHVAHPYLSDLFELLQRRFPDLQVRMRSGSEYEMLRLLSNGDADIVIAPLAEGLPPDVRAVELVSLPLVLLVHQESAIREAAQVWGATDALPRLARPETSESVLRSFDRGIQALGVRWTPTIVADSLLSVTSFVLQKSADVGLSIDVGPCVDHPQVRAIPLAGFDPVRIAVYCCSTAPELSRLLIEALQRRAKLTWGTKPAQRRGARI